MNQHVSHQNGLDVDVYYPRRDRQLSAHASSQIDRDLAQDLLDRFVAAGARMVFVGYSTRLRGPDGVVVPYPNHENHMHVRFPSLPAEARIRRSCTLAGQARTGRAGALADDELRGKDHSSGLSRLRADDLLEQPLCGQPSLLLVRLGDRRAVGW